MRFARLGVVLLLALVGVAALVISMPFTETGTRVLLGFTASLTGIDLEHGNGELLGDLELQRVRYADRDMVITLDGLRARLDRDCLVGGNICLPQNRRHKQTRPKRT